MDVKIIAEANIQLYMTMFTFNFSTNSNLVTFDTQLYLHFPTFLPSGYSKVYKILQMTPAIETECN